jgi:hypothetical protein
LKATSKAVEAAIATVDHSDIRGSVPHNRDPSGAASDYQRGFGPAYRIGSLEGSPFRVPLGRHRCRFPVARSVIYAAIEGDDVVRG